MKEKLSNLYNKNLTNKILFGAEILLSFIILGCVYKVALAGGLIYKVICIPSIVILLISMILLLKKYYKKIEYIFLILVIPIGLSYTFLMLPGRVPDEGSHIGKAYTVMKGDLFPKADKKDIPIMNIVKQYSIKDVSSLNSYKALSNCIHKKVNYNKEYRAPYDTFAGYFFGNYIIPSLGLLVGRIFNINIFISIFIGRLFNLIFFIITGFLCLKHIPFGKLLLFTYLLTPMILQEAASFASDACINCISIIFITYILYLKFNDKIKNLSIKNVAILGFLSIMLGAGKIVYFPLILLLLLLMDKIKNSDKKSKYLLGILMVLTIISTVFFYFQSNKYNVFIEWRTSVNVNPGKQMKSVITKPLKYMNTTVNTLKKYNGFYIESFIGEYLGLLDIPSYYITTLVMVILLLIAPFIEKTKYTFSKKEKIFINILVFITFNCVLGALYLTWTGYGNHIIEGVQGRYFIPIVILTLLTLFQKKKYIEFKNPKLYYILILLAIHWGSLSAVFGAFK